MQSHSTTQPRSTTLLLTQFTSDQSSLLPMLDELDQTMKDLQSWLIEEFQFRKIRANMFRVARVSCANMNAWKHTETHKDVFAYCSYEVVVTQKLLSVIWLL